MQQRGVIAGCTQPAHPRRTSRARPNSKQKRAASVRDHLRLRGARDFGGRFDVGTFNIDMRKDLVEPLGDPPVLGAE